jgi:hypothetical protein
MRTSKLKIKYPITIDHDPWLIIPDNLVPNVANRTSLKLVIEVSNVSQDARNLRIHN